MSPYFLDTNVILRHLLADDPELYARARGIIAAIEAGQIDAWTSDLVIAEVVFVLSGKRTYNQTPQEISAVLLPIIGLPHLKIPHKRMYGRTFALYTSLGIDYIDAYNAALMEQQGQPELLSFDPDFDRVPGIARHETVPERS